MTLPTKEQILTVRSLERRAGDLRQQARLMRERWAEAMLKGGRSSAQVYDICRVPLARIAEMRSTLGLITVREASKHLDASILALWDEGLMMGQIAKALECRPTHVGRVLRRFDRLRPASAVEEARQRLAGMMGAMG